MTDEKFLAITFLLLQRGVVESLLRDDRGDADEEDTEHAHRPDCDPGPFASSVSSIGTSSPRLFTRTTVAVHRIAENTAKAKPRPHAPPKTNSQFEVKNSETRKPPIG
ncbi:hypothetical protein HYG77_38890 (plasmid) [Rhodococcus sp. ZPP]|uniref:hypothetical protein n=1 Tax=Rhodococcus sp. ZPP TaxID=2749906 RepID=UPI001AD883A2|nr:hypothetical protein [Rhodococcus sp. ZPP]QTJ71402.1 hypothetical protein HYG77_38890 [Rhodococcus sp. ZPP]